MTDREKKIIETLKSHNKLKAVNYLIWILVIVALFGLFMLWLTSKN